MAVETFGNAAKKRSAGPGGFAVKKLVCALLGSCDFEKALENLDIAPIKIINPLLGFLAALDELTRWRAIRGVGITVSAIAATDIEAAREIMRRLIWSLNDESGGIGWGAPEAMGEIMAENETLACEYHRILLSYIDENGNPLENGLLERGVMWGVARLAQKRPGLLRDFLDPIVSQLQAGDPVKRGLALKTLLLLAGSSEKLPEPGRLAPLLRLLSGDPSEIRLFEDGAFSPYKIGDMAGKLLSLPVFFLETPEGPGPTPRENR
ncbi:MAG: hypothetical protein P4L43_10590 [Syntrophobacteraceae bacterium]|nr:hypothetical protein [Syntrophobacteraceae bacterium]